MLHRTLIGAQRKTGVLNGIFTNCDLTATDPAMALWWL
jgi:hypothetical protein